MDPQKNEVPDHLAQEENPQEVPKQHAQEENPQEVLKKPAQEECSQKESKQLAQEEPPNEVVIMDILQYLKLQLESGLRQEIQIYCAIVDITRKIANMFPENRKYKELVANLDHELRLHSIVNYNVKLLLNSDNSSDVNSALMELEDRKDLFAEQFNFVTGSMRYGQSDLLYPRHLLSMCFERQRLIFVHIDRHKYIPPHGINHGSPRMKKFRPHVKKPGLPSSSESEELVHLHSYLNSSGSEEEYYISSPPVQHVKQAKRANEAEAEKPEETNSKRVRLALAEIVDTIFKIPEEDRTIIGNRAGEPSSPKPATGQDNDERSENKSVGGTTQSSAIDPAFLAPGCSTWIPPFK